MNAQPKRAQPRVAFQTITPTQASRYLEANRSNRPLSRSSVDSYVGAMLAGEWMLNAEPIKFDWDGRLVDGQHRLAAIVKAKTPQQFLVVWDLDPEVFKTLDTGKKRTADDVLAIRGVYNPYATASALRLLHRTLAAQLGGKKRISNTTLDQLLAAHPLFARYAAQADHKPYHTTLVNAGPRMFAFYMAVHVDDRKAGQFFRSLAGHPDPGDPPQPNAVKLRERLESTMDEIVKPSPKVRLAWLIDAWNHTVDGTRVGHFSRILTELPDWNPMPGFTR